MSIPLWNNKSYRLKSDDQKIAKNLELKFPEKMKFITEKSFIHYWGVIILRLFYLLLGVICKEEKGYQNLSMEVIIYRKKITGECLIGLWISLCNTFAISRMIDIFSQISIIVSPRKIGNDWYIQPNFNSYFSHID